MTTNEKVMKYLQKKYPLEKNTTKKPTTIMILDTQPIFHITDDIKEYLENFKDLEEITLSICKLNSLSNLPDLPKLSKIELSDNHIKGKELSNLCKYKNLVDLRMANSDIENFEEIKCLENLSELTNIDFSENPISKIKDYREKMFQNFKKLKYLDGTDKNGNPFEEDDDEEDEEDELEEDKGFIDDEKKEGDEEDEADDEDEIEGKNDNDDDEEDEQKEEEDEDEIKNPNPSKKKKLE